MRTTLLPSLRDDFYRLPELGVIYTPDVLVFRDEDGGQLGKRDRWFVDCLSAAMLRFPETDVDEHGRARYTSARDGELVLGKMRAVMRVAQAKGIRRLVLGAWGCGAYGNPVSEVAASWRRVLLGRGDGPNARTARDEWPGIEEVVFAIRDAGMAAGFAEAFGVELHRDGGWDGGDDSHCEAASEADDVERARLEELRERMAELQSQLAEARTPHLQQGLRAVLAGLQRQVAASVESTG